MCMSVRLSHMHEMGRPKAGEGPSPGPTINTCGFREALFGLKSSGSKPSKTVAHRFSNIVLRYVIYLTLYSYTRNIGM